MKNLFAGTHTLFVFLSLFISSRAAGQLTGIKSIPGDYTTISLAVNALNSAGVGTGGVTFNVAANYTENISATIALTATGTVSNPVLFQKDPLTTGANPLITAYTGGVGTPSTAVQDGIWRLSGSDYTTISGIDLRDNAANTTNPSTMEYGYALYKASTSNGCQYVTIQNCTITLNRINNAGATAPMTEGCAGIIVMNAISTAANASVTAITGGSNSNNKFYGNTIQNCNIGISMISYAPASTLSLADSSNDIGGSSAVTGNTIINFGGAPGATNAAAAIRTSAQYKLNVSYNFINSNNGTGTNHANALRGIFVNTAKSAGTTITYNTVTLKGGGTTQQLTGIENASGSTPAGNTVNIGNNTITNCSYTTATTGNFYGIYNSGTPAVIAINNNTVLNNSSAATSTASTAGLFYGIYNSGAASAVTINNNTLTGNSTGSSIGAFTGIINGASSPVLNINSNTLAGDSTATITGSHYSIYNSGTVTATLNMNSNNIGTNLSPAIKFISANSATQYFIYNSKGGSAANLSVSSNNFYNVLYSSTIGTGANTYILNSAGTLSQAINGNTFTNLSVNTTGSITFISNSVIVPAAGTQDVNSNTISGTFAKTGGGGTVTLFISTASCLAGSIINNNSNNFSNITVTGSTVIAGWINTDAGNSTKTIQNNIFSNWAGGTGTITAMSINITGTNNSTKGNAISNIAGTGNITGITTGSGKDNIYANTVNNLVSSGTTATLVSGINITAGTTKNIYLNNIYNLQGNTLTTGAVRGILVSGGTTVNAFQNNIYALQANAITTGTVNGILISGGATVSAYSNKVYDLSSTSSAITSGIVYGIQVTGTTANSNVTLRNNLIGDLRTPLASATDPIRAMSIISTGATSAIHVYNNTINLNGTSTGANFGSTGIYHLTSATATTATLDLRNNIINNTSVPNGTYLTVAFRRSNNTLTNYDAASNNNLFYAGLAAPNRLIYYDLTNSDQFLSTYKARVATRDAQSVTEDMIGTSKFISTTGSSTSFLHLDSTKSTQAESGAISIGSVPTDFDAQLRQGANGYSGTGTAPDIGADEINGISSPVLAGTYNVGAGQTYTSLTNAGGLFAAINSLGLSGNTVVNITSDLTENGTNVLYQWVEKGVGNYKLIIQPDASTERIISGNVLTGLIRFNGAKQVTIDGSNGTANNYLTFRNTNTAATTGSAFTFINGAANNVIKYCNIEAYANATNGVMLFSTSTVAGGNSNNTISNCSINATVGGNSGSVCIYSAGTVGNENVANLVTNNKIYNYRDRALDIASTGSKSWNISSNSCYNGDVSGTTYLAGALLHGIRILGGSGYTLLNNYIGGNSALASGTIASYSSAGILSFQGILLTTSSTTPASTISGNTVANISVSAVPTSTTSANVFTGIETNGSGISIGGILPGDGNTVGSNVINSSITVSTTTTSNTFPSLIRGINCNSAGGLVINNQVGGIDINNVGTSPSASTFYGIFVNNASAPSQVNLNVIGSTGSVANSIRVLATSTSPTTLVTGIAIGSSVISAVQADGNIVRNISFLSATTSMLATGGFIGISSAAAGAASVTITNNTISKDSIANYTTGYFYGIYNSGAASSVSVNNNTLTGNSSNSASGLYFAIYNTGGVTSAINMDYNTIGNSSASAFSFYAINTGAHIFIYNAGGAATAALSVSNNNFQNINYVAAGTGNNTYISNSAATLSQTINGNAFTNLSVNTAGIVTFISDNVAVPATGSQNVNNNSIVTAFTKRAGGSVTLFTNLTNSVPGSITNNNNNNFSNITVSGTTAINGWINADGSTSTKMVQNNTFTNWVAGTGNITAISVSIAGTTNATSGNIINNITSAGAIVGITTGAGIDNIFSNTINALSTTGNAPISGIFVSAGTTKNIYKNKIYALTGSSSGSTINGITVNGGTTVNVFNNLVSDLRDTAASNADPIRGINITSTATSSSVNIYYNTVYLNASSSSTFFGTTGLYHAASATATIASLDLRNNIIINTSAVKGAGYTVAFRRSAAALNNYASTSNNNLFYAGTPGTAKYLYWDASTGDQVIANYKTRVSPRDVLSITEDVSAKFLSIAGSSPVFLHINSNLSTAIEGGGANVSGYTDDYDGQIRAGNPGYTGSSTLPDIGADEIFGIEAVPPTITYTLLTNTTVITNRDLTNVLITDASGVNTAGGTKPRIYYKRSTDANVLLDNTSSTNGWKYKEANNASSPFTFTIDYSLLSGGSSVTAGIIQYFIVAQDLATTANVAINSGTFAATPASVALTSAAFPIAGTINSYNIAFAGTYRVGASEVFTSLTKADGLFASINSAGLMGNSTFIITSNIIENGANALNQWSELGAGNYTLTIQPDAATLRTISGNVTAGLIRLNGADRVTIDGSNGGGGIYLSFKNTNTAGATGTAFTFINGSTNNTIRYCDAQAYGDAGNGVILFGSATTGGNSNNLIDNCTINATIASNTGNLAIYSAGTPGNENVSNTVSNNNIYGYRDRGLDITATGSSAWNIIGNSFYNGNVTSAINYAASSALHGIRILGGSGYSISNNYIGGSNTMASGANAIYSSTLGNLSYQGILLTTSNASPASNIRGNSIAAISLSTVPTSANSNAFTGIETNGSAINIGGSLVTEGNLIGSTAANGSIVVTTSTAAVGYTSNINGINCLSSGGIINNNRISGFDISNVGATPAPSFVQGIYLNNAAAPTQVNNNLVGSAFTSNSIRILAASTAASTSLTGIRLGPAINSALQVNSNRIENIGNLSATSSGSFTGISNTATLSGAVITISNDTIQLVNTAANSNSASAGYSGIVSSSAAIINNNIISDFILSSNGVNAQITGINISGAYANTVSGNVVSNLSTASGKVNANVETGSPASSAIIGILNSATVAGQVINNNRLSGFSATSNAGINVGVTGIGITSTGAGNIFNNRFGTMINLATGAAPSLCHIVAAGGSFNVYNNTLRISNLTNTNSLKIYGIVHSSSTSWNYFHNTIRVGGSSNGIAMRSAAFLLSANSSPVLKDNIFFNIRTGTGFNYAVSNLSSPPSSWVATASDYNDFYSINSNTVAEWGSGVGETFTQWKSLSGGDAHSISNAISFITSTYDLEPDSISNCAFDNAGTLVTTPVLINTDINNKSRSGTSPDLGAYEFSYTGFVIIAGNNSPVCAGDSVTLSVDPGNSISPHFTWRNPANVIISTIQSPTFALTTGQYKITVTDSTGCSQTDSTLVLVDQRPTARITSTTSLCDSGTVNLNLAVTGKGTINGTLSNGDDFSGTAPLIVISENVTGTTSFSIVSLSDSTCTSIAADIPDTITVTVTHKGDWQGITTNWHDPANWCGGTLPTSSTDVTIPAGTLKMPLITDSVYCNNLFISSGDTLTITGTGTLNVAGVITNNGVYIDNGTTNFNGNFGQQTFSGIIAFNNLTINSTGNLLLPAAISVKNNLTISTGILDANNFSVTIRGNWINNLSTTAFIGGTAAVTFNGTAPQMIGGSFATTFNILTVADTLSTVTLNVNISVSSILSVLSGTFDLGGFTANRTSAGGTLAIAGNAMLKIGGTNIFPANYATNTLDVSSTVEYSGTAQTVSNQTYGNLTFSSSGGAAIKTLPGTAFTIVGNFSSTKGAGTSVSYTAASAITINGNVSIGASTTFSGGAFSHTVGGNWTNNGTFSSNANTTITFTGAGKLISGAGVQNFRNLAIAAAGINLSANSITILGNLTTTGSGSFTQASGGTIIMTGASKSISGSGLFIDNLTVSGTVSTLNSLNISGNLAVSGSFTANATRTVTMSGISKTISGSGTIKFSPLNVTGAITTNTNFFVSSGLTVSGSLSATAGTATFTDTASLSGTANLYNISVNGVSFQLGSGSVLGVANVLTITSGKLDVNTSGPNTINFNGAGDQNINAITYSNLALSNGGTKSAIGADTTLFDITIGTGTTFSLSSYTLSLYGNWINNGTFNQGTSNVQFLGPATAYITGATTFNILTSNTTSSTTELILQSNTSASIVNMTLGSINTGTNTLTITNTRTGSGIILGNIQRTHNFTTGVAYAFEGPDNTITFSSATSVGSVTVSVAEGSISDFPFGGSISRVYNIAVPAGSYTATLRLHYEDDELNGNNESSMGLWHYNGSTWVSAGKSGNSTTSNYVELSPLTDITNRWTASDNSNLVQWNGSVSTDWNTAGNWTILQGSASTPPSSTDIVDLGTATFGNQPTINTSVTVKNIIFGSVQAVTLTIGNGGSLTTLGNISGTWATNAIHSINVNDQSLTVNGDIILSDGTNGNAINLNAGSGSVTTLGSLWETGNASINFTGGGALNIGQDFNYSSGLFTAGGGTVTYNGFENQKVANVNYNNLTVNKPGGLAAINNPANIAGNLIIVAGELDNFSNTTISGNVTINAGDTINNYQDLHVKGNWNNNGIFIGTGSNTYFDGSGPQTITASAFNNLIINKPVGSSAVLTGDIIINGDLTLTSGILDIKTFNCNRSVLGGTEKITDSATLIMAARNFPTKFSNYLFASNSTHIFNGTDSQFVRLSDGNFGHLILRNAGIKTLTSAVRVNGNLTIENGSNFNGSTQTLTLNGNWVNNGTFIPSSGTVINSGTGKTVSGNTTFNKVTITGSYTNLSNITYNNLLNITSSGSISSGGGIFTTLNGDLINSGTLYTLGTTTFTGTILQTLSLINSVQTVALIVNFNGSVSPVLNSTSPPQYGYLNINNTAGVNPSVGWTVLYDMTVGSGASFNGGLSTHNLMGSLTNNGTMTSSGVLNFKPAAAATVNLGSAFSSTGSVIFGGAGAITMAGTPVSFHDVVVSNTNIAGITPSSNWSITNNFMVNNGSILNAGNQTYLVRGGIANNGAIRSQTSTFTLNGTAAQDVYTLSDFNNLTINKTSGVTTLSSDATVNGALNFISGQIQTNGNALVLSPSGNITGAAQNTGWVNGNLRKNVAIGSNVSRTFEIGDATYYTPATVLFTTVSVNGNFLGSSTPAEHPQIDLSGINKNLDVNRYWTFTNTGTAFATAASTFNWVASDVDAGATTSHFKISVYNSGLWGFSKLASPLATSIQATGLTSFGAFAVGEGPSTTTWTGQAGTADWFTSGNWFGGVPDTTVKTLIPANLQPGKVFPVIGQGIAIIDTATVETAASLTVTGSTLKIKGSVINHGTFDVRNGTIEMNGIQPQTIQANTFTGNTALSLVISNNVTLAGEDSITGTLSFGGNNKSLNTGGFLTLKSTQTGTARVADITNGGTNTGNTILGNVHVERFITAKRAWRLLTAPIGAAGAPSINAAWQEGQISGNTIPGYGTQITGGSPANGFDQSPGNSVSLKGFNSSTNSWTAILGTNNPVTDSAGYMLFMRGDRSIDLSQGVYAVPTSTVLRSTGKLKTGNQTYNVAAANFTVVGNPYASPIDLQQIERNNVQNNFYLWDPKLSGSNGVGGFINISWNGASYDVTPSSGGSGLTQYIQSGSAFLAKSMDSISGGSLVIKETDKSATASMNVNRTPMVSTSSFKTNLYVINKDGTSSTVDGILNGFANVYSNGIDSYDAVKLNNFSESLSSQRGGKSFVVERRQPIGTSDTIFFNMVQMKAASYQFEFVADNFDNNGLSAFLEDSYNNTRMAINIQGITTFNFTVIDIPASWNPHRFRVVFRQSSVLPVFFSNIKALGQNNNIRVEWQVENETNISHYEIEKSADGQHFIKVKTVLAYTNNSTSNYSWTDGSIVEGNNYYRIKSIGINRDMQYSAIVKVLVSSGSDQITLNPNPVINDVINMHFKNQPTGKYIIQLFNGAGQLIFSKNITHNIENDTEIISISNRLAKGIYKLVIIKPGAEKVVITLLQ